MLQLNENGRFRILIIADVQDCRVPDENKKAHLDRLIRTAKPQLVVLLGDILFGPGIFTGRRVGQIVDAVVTTVERHRVPFVYVSGNHDMDARVPVRDQVDMYRKSAYCLTPSIAERACADAYALDVGTEGRRAAARLIFMDSGATRVTISGIRYYPPREELLHYTDLLLSDVDCPPAYIFQHIPVPEICRLLQAVPPDTPGSIKGHGPYRGKRLALMDSRNGVLGEMPCPSWENTRQFSAWVSSGKVRAAVFGHDHKNAFAGCVEGITFLQTSCAGLSCYGDAQTRGGRLLEISRNGSFASYPLFYRDVNG